MEIKIFASSGSLEMKLLFSKSILSAVEFEKLLLRFVSMLSLYKIPSYFLMLPKTISETIGKAPRVLVFFIK